ncbi:hypothetical protein T8K17_26065 (plasmid) [Thalassobaculum sp. OXR-137]|uniref:hypothetical protein n=1 Tax=Thalassobaculum sp. OXR-137 TaxID=3100173 RepID=UPI002AC94484|nr:hypothetical protein [Thalassobaculum sp. OXR-137]WPZ37190.1 hypothetical protein T8K17_26065 [Thalassobaculum sp. OXR-137]
MARDKGEGIASFTELYQRMVSDRPFVSALLSGHLAVEFLLRRLVRQYDPKLAEHGDTLRHRSLIGLNRQLGTISDAQYEVLISLNALRNRLAHEISYEPTLDELLELWRRAAQAFSDLTDGISQGIDSFEAAASLREVDDWAFAELFVQISYDLHEQYVSRGGDLEEF